MGRLGRSIAPEGASLVPIAFDPTGLESLTLDHPARRRPMNPDLSAPGPPRCLWPLLFALLVACEDSPPGESPGGHRGPSIFLDISFDEALEVSKKRGVPVFVSVQSPLRDRSGPALDREIWTDIRIAELLLARTLPIKVIADESPDFVAEHEIWFFPTFLLLNDEGQVTSRIQGMREAEFFYMELEALLDDLRKNDRVQTN